VVATFVELSAGACVVAVVISGNAEAADSAAAVPVLSWLSVGTSAAWMTALMKLVPLPRRKFPAVAVSLRSAADGRVAEGTPAVEIVLIQLWDTATKDSIPPKVDAVGLGNCAAGNLPDVMFVAFVVSVLQLGAASDRSPQAGCALDGTPEVEIVVRKLCVVSVMDCTPPSVEAEGTGNRAAGKVPLEMLVATVVSVVADAASPEMSPAAICANAGTPELNCCKYSLVAVELTVEPPKVVLLYCTELAAPPGLVPLPPPVAVTVIVPVPPSLMVVFEPAARLSLTWLPLFTPLVWSKTLVAPTGTATHVQLTPETVA
jgi:hypothetical protein